jgi:hypothetical protein
MAHFNRPLTVTKIDLDLWVVEIPFRYYIGDESSFVDVPDGTLTDFASVPRILWPIFPPDGAYTQAAVLHDFLYTNHIKTRKESDDIFLEAMVVLKVPAWQKNTMYWAVRIFGRLAWNEINK